MGRNEFSRPEAVPPTEREYRAAEKLLGHTIPRGLVQKEKPLPQKIKSGLGKLSSSVNIFKR